MPKPQKEIKCSDETINSYGFWVKTSGIDLTQFNRNPVMFYNHNKYNSPIGRWEDIRVEGGSLYARPVFDLDDEFAKKIALKYENNFIRGCSIGFVAMEVSEDPKDLKQGQTMTTVTKCKMVEMSICDIPSNDNSVVLYDDTENVVNLSAGNKLNKIKNINLNKEKMETIALLLGLAATATEAEVLVLVQSLLNKKNEAETKLKMLEEKAKTELTARIRVLVENAVKLQKITADKKDLYLAIGQSSGVESLEQVLLSINPIKASAIIAKSTDHKSTEAVKFSTLNTQEIAELRENDTENYITLFEEEYGFKPTIKK